MPPFQLITSPDNSVTEPPTPLPEICAPPRKGILPLYQDNTPWEWTARTFHFFTGTEHFSAGLDTEILFLSQIDGNWTPTENPTTAASIIRTVQTHSVFAQLPTNWLRIFSHSDANRNHHFNIYDKETNRYVFIRFTSQDLTNPTFHYVDNKEQILTGLPCKLNHQVHWRAPTFLESLCEKMRCSWLAFLAP